MRTIPKLFVFVLSCLCLFLFWCHPSFFQHVLSDSPHHKSNDPYLPIVVSYFHKKLPSGEFVDANDPSYRIVVGKVQDLTKTSSVELTVSPSLVDNGDIVTVTWEGAPVSKRPFDWIALFCPHDADVNSYLDYWLVKETSTAHEGYGEINFRIYNLRVDCEFRYYSDDTHTQLLARSNAIKFRGGAKTPLQGHLALTGNSKQMRVQWTSGSNSTPVVLYGVSPNELDYKATGHWTTYKASDMCGEPANNTAYFIDPGYLHDVLLTDLKPNTLYYFQYGSDNIFSNIEKFTSALPVGSDKSFKFVTYGDMGVGFPGAEVTAELMKQEINEGANFVIHQGDLSYALGHAYIWEQWMHLIEYCAIRIPYMIGIGNHEQDHIEVSKKDPSGDKGNGYHPAWGNFNHDSGGECGVPVFYRFHMPDNGNKIWWYSFDYGLIHFTMMSTEHNFTYGSKQYQWLEKDLSSVDRQVTPWLILVGHRPMYTSEKYAADHRVALHMQIAFEELLHKYNVDLALWGHYHSYERTCRVYRSRCTPSGTIHIVIGSAGADIDSAPQYDVPWSEHLEMSYGYGRVSVVNSSALLWEFIRNLDRSVSDSVWIHR